MGSLSIPPTGPVYLDANCIVYRIEQVEPYLTLLRPVFEAAKSGTVSLVTSELSLLECLVKPVREGNHAVEHLFRAVLQGSRELRLVPITRGVLEHAIRLRAVQGLKAPDAIHAGTAIEASCGTLLTNDPVFRRVPDFAAQILGEVAP